MGDGIVVQDCLIFPSAEIRWPSVDGVEPVFEPHGGLLCILVFVEMARNLPDESVGLGDVLGEEFGDVELHFELGGRVCGLPLGSVVDRLVHLSNDFIFVHEEGVHMILDEHRPASTFW